MQEPASCAPLIAGWLGHVEGSKESSLYFGGEAADARMLMFGMACVGQVLGSRESSTTADDGAGTVLVRGRGLTEPAAPPVPGTPGVTKPSVADRRRSAAAGAAAG